jgi:ribosomal protein S18 acetylase RimI-like enzyme
MEDNDMGIVIRRMQNGDEAEVMAAPEIFDDPPNPEAVSALLSEERDHLLFAYVDGQAAGMARAVELMRPDTLRRQMFLYEIGTEPAFQRQGVARALIEDLLQMSHERDCLEMFVLTGESNEAAMRLYEMTGGVRENDDDVMFVWTLAS